jgi:hypothetical protein
MNQPAGKRIGRALRKNQAQRNWAGKRLELPEAKRQAHAEAGLQFNPVLRTIRGEARASKQRANREIPQWYHELGNTLDQSAQQTAASSAAANAALQKQLETAQQGSQAQQAQIAGQNADFAKLVGADPAAFAQGTQTAAAAANQRSLMGATLAAPIIQSGATQVGYLAAQKGNAARDSIYQRLQERKRGTSIRQDLQAAQREKGRAQVEAFGKLREGERNYDVQRKAFGFEKQKFGAEQKAAGAEAALKAKEAAIAQGNEERKLGQGSRKLGIEERKANSEAKHGGLTSKERREQKEGRRGAAAAVKSLYEFPHGKGSVPAKEGEGREWASWGALETALRKESEITPLEAKRAVEKLRQHVEAEGRATKPSPKPSTKRSEASSEETHQNALLPIIGSKALGAEATAPGPAASR